MQAIRTESCGPATTAPRSVLSTSLRLVPSESSVGSPEALRNGSTASETIPAGAAGLVVGAEPIADRSRSRRPREQTAHGRRRSDHLRAARRATLCQRRRGGGRHGQGPPVATRVQILQQLGARLVASGGIRLQAPRDQRVEPLRECADPPCAAPPARAACAPSVPRRRSWCRRAAAPTSMSCRISPNA